MYTEFENSSVQHYLGTLQGVINRMAANSANCKTWCVTLVSAIAVVISTKGQPDFVWIALIPVILFLFLDAYYLSLERGFIRRYNEFIKNVRSKKATPENIYDISPLNGSGKTLCSISKAFASFSIWPFYGLLIIMLLIARYVIL